MEKKNNSLLFLFAIVVILGSGALLFIAKLQSRTRSAITQPPLTAGQTSPAVSKTQQVNLPGAFTMKPAAITVKRGELVQVAIKLAAPRKQIDAADALVLFDPKMLQFVDARPAGMFEQYPRARRDAKQNRVIVTGIQLNQPLASPAGEFVALTFKARKRGRTALTFDRQRSKIVETRTAKNVLGRLDNANITIN